MKADPAGKRYATLEANGWTHEEIAKHFAVTPANVRRMINDWRKREVQIIGEGTYSTGRTDTVKLTTESLAADAREIVSEIAGYADQRRETAMAYLGTTLNFEYNEMPRLPEKRRRIVAVGDLHGSPSNAILAALIAAQPDIVVLGGDLTQQEQANPHKKTSPKKNKRLQLQIQQELANVRAFIETILTELPNAVIVIIRGNHDDWLYKVAADVLPEKLLEWFFRDDGCADPLEVLIAGLPPDRVEVATTEWIVNLPGEVTAEFGESQYMLILGDVLFSHGNFTSSTEGGAVRNLHQWLYVKGWHEYLGLPKLNVLVQFHGHKIADLRPAGGNWRWIEPGMAGEPHVEAYKAEYKMSWSPGGLGGVVIDQEWRGSRWKSAAVNILEPLFNND